jgi:hypothetical protein
VLPFGLLALAALIRAFFMFDYGAPLPVIYWVIAPAALVLGNLIALSCFPWGLLIRWWVCPLIVVAVNGAYGALVFWKQMMSKTISARNCPTEL